MTINGFGVKFMRTVLRLTVVLVLCGIGARGIEAQTAPHTETNARPAAIDATPVDKTDVGNDVDIDQTDVDQTDVDKASIEEEIVVSATRYAGRLSDTPSSIVVLSEAELRLNPALTLDDKLRSVPGFQLFRRAGSRTANPTTQGISLRGIGASGASRAQVLFDGVPLNDAFGGWIYWGRVPRTELKQVEVLRGGASDLYGGSALSGAILLERKRSDESNFDYQIETSFGTQRTPEGSWWLGKSFGKWNVALSGEALRTSGFITVDEQERGAVDTPADSRRASAALTVERTGLQLPFAAKSNRLFGRIAYYGEGRTNGTALQNNATRWREAVTGFDFETQTFGATRARLFANTQDYRQTFSAIALDRNRETLTRAQLVPSSLLGANLQTARSFNTRLTVVGGFDARTIRGASQETIFANDRATSNVEAGGREQSFGVFALSLIQLTNRLTANLGGRFDAWRTTDGRTVTQSLINPSTQTRTLADNDEQAFSPRASLLFKANNNISFSATVTRAFRQPTLNELYRAFRVGNVLTLANEALRAERATTWEAGANFVSNNNRLQARGVFFQSGVARNIANLTVEQTPALITRRRANLGATRTRGVEVDAEARLTKRFSVSGGYLFADARVTDFAENPSLVKLRVPQIARHQLTLQTGFNDVRLFDLNGQLRFNASAFDDDLNTLPLNRFTALDVFAARRVRSNVDVFVAFENLTDTRIETNRTPVTTLAAGRTARIGLRLSSRR